MHTTLGEQQMDSKVIEILERKFEKKDIKQRQGSFGRMLDYVEGHRVIQRLNEAFQGDWSFNILTPTHQAIVGDSVIVHVQITAKIGQPGEWISRDGIGGKKLTKVRGKDEYLDLASDFKAATTDALKKAASTLGVALDLYGIDDEDEKKPAEKAAVRTEEAPAEDGPAKPNQILAIRSMVDKKKLNLGEVLAKFKAKNIEELKESTAKDIIVFLNKA